MNSEAVRARNARKRAKLRAKTRGEGCNLCRLLIETEIWTDAYRKWLEEFDSQDFIRGENGYWELEQWIRSRSINSKFMQKQYVVIVSPVILITSHDVSSHCLEMMEVHGEQAAYYRYQVSSQNHTPGSQIHRSTWLYVTQGEFKGAKQWLDGDLIGPADVAAELGRMRAQSANPATSSNWMSELSFPAVLTSC